MKLAGLYVRILVAWLLAMQPMLGAYASAQAANVPFAMELCRGGPAPSANIPGQSDVDHSQCCMACAPVSAPPPRAVAIGTPVLAFAERPAVLPGHIPVTRAELGPQSARAPPL